MLTVRALPTPYDPPAGTLTVATPSCCCSSCCCCCLNVVAAAAGVTASAARTAAAKNGRPAGAATALGFVAVLAGVGVGVLAARLHSPDGQLPLASGMAVYAVVAVLTLRRAGVRLGTALGMVAAVTAGSLALLFVEVPLAAVTRLWIELASPLALWGGWALGRSVMRGLRDGQLPAVEHDGDG